MANVNPDFAAFLRQIENLDIELSQTSDGVLTACSTAEPLFCYDADTREELAALVASTLASYAKHFYHIDGLDVTAEEAPFESGPLPVERSTPLARYKPVFDLAA